MSVASGSIRPSLASLFRWGSVPGSPGEVRAYLERRVTIYLGFAAAFWGAAWLLTLVSAIPFAGNSRGFWARRATIARCRFIAAAHMSAWRARNFRRKPKRMCIAKCVLKS